jgi:hypothetical protein
MTTGIFAWIAARAEKEQNNKAKQVLRLIGEP